MLIRIMIRGGNHDTDHDQACPVAIENQSQLAGLASHASMLLGALFQSVTIRSSRSGLPPSPLYCLV